MKRTLYAIPALSVIYLLFALVSCRMPNNPKPPATDTCCHGTMTIHVADSSGKTKAGTPVNVTGPDGKVHQMTTDANGNVKLDGLCPGKYSISVPSSNANSRSTNTSVQMGCNDHKELKLVVGGTPPPPPPPPPADTCCHGHLAVHVVDANGNPVAGAPVTLIGSDGKTHQAKSDANGNAMFDGLCDGQYKLTVAAANSPQGGTTVGVEMGCNDKKEVKLVTAGTPPPPPPPPQDSCCNGVLTVHVVDANGNPVAGAPVTIRSSGGQVFTVPSNANGDAVFEHLCNGAYAVTTTTQSASGGSVSGSTSVSMGCNDKADTKLVLQTTSR
jgi:hypothetical protein